MIAEDTLDGRVRLATTLMGNQTRARDVNTELQRLAQKREQTEDDIRSMAGTDFLRTRA
jgi:hypothetical protein